MPDTDDTTEPTTKYQPEPASVCLDIDEHGQVLVDEWPRVGHDRDVVLCAALLAETVTQLLRGDHTAAAAVRAQLHDAAERAAEEAWPSAQCEHCGDTLNAGQIDEHIQRMHEQENT